MFNTITSARDIDPDSPNYANQLKHFYESELESILFVLNEATEFVESDLKHQINDTSNTAIGLNMMNVLAKRVDGLLA